MTVVTREQYQQSLETLRENVLDMGELVTDRLDSALSSLATGDETLARTVIEGDEEINDTYLALEQQCVELLALQQPVASDLRLISASFKIITDLERIGDLATNLGEYALAVRQDWPSRVAVDDIGRDALSLLDRSLDAYATQSADACQEIATDDDRIDALCQRANETVVRDLITHEADGDGPWAVEELLDEVSRVLLTIRDIERIADHAVNIAARTLYMIENDPRLIY